MEPFYDQNVPRSGPSARSDFLDFRPSGRVRRSDVEDTESARAKGKEKTKQERRKRVLIKSEPVDGEKTREDRARGGDGAS